MAKISLVEFHDGQVERVVLERGGRMVIRFSCLNVYEEKEIDRYDVVAYDAELSAVDVVELHCRGALEHTSRISFIRLNGDEPTSSSLEGTVAILKAGGYAELCFDNGTIISFQCSRIELELGQRGEVIEQWEGPLG
jgi:hypothetical protein